MPAANLNRKVPPDETVARFVFYRKRIRPDLTVKADEFIPYPYPDLSVTRHIGLTEQALWAIGLQIGTQRRLPLAGRVDLAAAVFISHRLKVVTAPVPDNPNHANVTDWPKDKPAQKIIAQQLAAIAGCAILTPGSEPSH